MEKEKVYVLATLHIEGEKIGMVSTEIYKEKNVAILDARSNADADFYIGGDRLKSVFFEYSEIDYVVFPMFIVNEKQQIYANKIYRPHCNSTTWRIVYEKELK